MSEMGGGQSLFEFDFANRTGGSYVSQNLFKGLGAKKTHKGHYQALLVGRNLVFNLNDGKTQLTIHALKAEVVPEQSWLSRFSLPLMMMVMMFVQRWLRPATPATNAAVANATANATGKNRKGGARVEEVPDATVDKKSN